MALLLGVVTYGCVAIAQSDDSNDAPEEPGSLPASFSTEDAQDTCGYLHFLGSTAVELDVSSGANALNVAVALDGTGPPQAVRSTARLSRFFADYRRMVERHVGYWAGEVNERPDMSPVVEGFAAKWNEWACADVPETDGLPVTDSGVPHQGSLTVTSEEP